MYCSCRTQLFFPEGFFKKTLCIMNTNDIFEKAGTDRICSGEILSYNRNNSTLQVRLYDNITGIIPVTNPKEQDFVYHSLVGTLVNFRIVSKIDEHHWLCDRESIITHAHEYINKHAHVGDVFVGKIDSFAAYGVFVDIGCGVNGLLHNNEIAKYFHCNFKHPSEVMKDVENVKVKIKEISDEKIALSLIGIINEC